MFDETCKWIRTKDLVWDTECKHQVGTPRKWEPIEGMACICCKKPVEVMNGEDTRKFGEGKNTENPR